MLSRGDIVLALVLGAACAGRGQAADWQFRPVTDSGLPTTGMTYGGTWADLDGDGNWDLVVSRHADHVAEIYLGTGVLRFAGPAAIELPPGLLDHHGTAACDYDADGDWDLFLSVGAERGHSVACKQLWRNEGALTLTGVVACDHLLADPAGRGRGALWIGSPDAPLPQLLLLNYQSPPRLFGPAADGVWRDFGDNLNLAADDWWTVAVADDFDGDGATDLFTAGGRREIRHNREGILVPVVIPTLAAEGSAVSAAASGDVDGDGDPDLLLGVRGGALWLLQNESAPGSLRFAAPRTFPDLPATSGPVSVALVDLDNDGRLDIAAAQRGRGGTAYAPLLARGRGDGTFVAVPHTVSGVEPVSSRAMCLWALDLDRDGDLDLVSFNGESYSSKNALIVYENLADTPGVTVELTAKRGAPPHGLGARVVLRDGDRLRTQTVRSAANPWNSTVLPVHFGLGDVGGEVALQVIWSDGTVSEHAGTPSGGAWQVQQDQEP